MGVSTIEIKSIPQEDYPQVHRLRDYCFPNKYVGSRREDFHYWVQHSQTLGAYNGEKVVGQLLVLPLNMTVHGVNYKMGGIGFVATYPENRNQGIMKKLMIQALIDMRKNEQFISVLAPFSVSFYRYFGWELFFEKLHYSIPTEVFPNFGQQVDDVKRMSFEWPDEAIFQDIQQFFNEQALLNNGSMMRDSAWWQRIMRREPDSHLAAYYRDNQIAGYVRYEISNLTFFVKDFIAVDVVAEQAIWRFITSHTASVNKIVGVTSNDRHFGFHFEQPQFKQEITKDVMVRIVDVFEFLKRYPWRDIQQPLYVCIKDTFGSWNDHLFKINKNGIVEKIEDNSIEDMHILAVPINLFSAMMVGYLSVKDTIIYANKAVTKEVIDTWQEAIPIGRPVFYEYF
ncbi:enhanced intracellular survival protein Eis [Lysinibacillus sp. NPDC096418]|uniref:GNAT family N-acetyltransferase n=1 Tax=Lysinibacillus sp. NPDC096418 TaxID=3364138 RepID=UPI0037FA8718